MSWLNGKQPGFQMVGGLHSGRSVLHLAKTFELADRAGLLRDPALAAFRMSDLPAVSTGVGRHERFFATVPEHRHHQEMDPGRGRRRLRPGRDPRDRARGGTGLPRPAWTRRPELIRDAGLRVSSLCRGGFLTAADAAGQAAALADNRAAVLEAVALGHPELFLVVGGLAPGEKDVVAPAGAWPTVSRTWCRSPPNTASGWCWSRCTRCTRRTGP